MEWLGPIVTTCGAAVAALFAYLTTRDKLRFDAEKVEMKANLAYLNREVESCHHERDDLAAWNGRQQTEINELRARLDDASRQHIALVERRTRTDPGYGGPERRSGPPEIQPE